MDTILIFSVGLVSLVIGAIIATKDSDEGRRICEQNLPRSEKCVMIFVPEKEVLNEVK